VSRLHLVAFNFSLLSLDVEPGRIRPASSSLSYIPSFFTFRLAPSRTFGDFFIEFLLQIVGSPCHYSRTANHTGKARKHRKRRHLRLAFLALVTYSNQFVVEGLGNETEETTNLYQVDPPVLTSAGLDCY
jgi:hypothetical protein